jgi:hypothetical protein
MTSLPEQLKKYPTASLGYGMAVTAIGSGVYFCISGDYVAAAALCWIGGVSTALAYDSKSVESRRRIHPRD